MLHLLRPVTGANLLCNAVSLHLFQKCNFHTHTNIARPHRLAIFFAALLGAAVPGIAAEQDPGVAVITPAAVAARGQQSAILAIKAFGRYSITVESPQGVALQAVDRMSGAGEIRGVAGKQDGRLDLFLDKGSYKILAHASSQGTGHAKLKAHAFRELNGAKGTMLVEERLENATLGDFEQRSYWIEIKEQRTVAIEAAGRHLADLRLWRDGVWLVENAPEMTISQARPERPLSVARFAARLEPGMYLVTAYGGASQPWTDASDEKTFLLRFGIPKLAAQVRQQFTMGEFGVERFLVPEGPNFFRLELPVATTASLQLGSYNGNDPFRAQGSVVSIDKKSLPPVAELNNIGGKGERLVTVTMEAGKSFILQYFDAASVKSFNATGNYWISSIHAGQAEDSVGATAILTRRPPNSPEEYVDAQVIELGRAPAWHRRFNLLDELTLFVKIADASKIKVVGQGVKARYRFEPFVTSRPRDYRTPPSQESGYEFQLDRGLYVLTVTPETKGILGLQLLPSGSVLNQAVSMVSKLMPDANQNPASADASRSDALSPVSPVARFAEAKLGNAYYTVYLNRQPGVASGIVLRQLPINLNEALPVTQRAGEKLSIPILVPEAGTLRALAEDGRPLEMLLNDGKKGTAIEIGTGRYSVAVKESNVVQNYSLALEPTRLSSKTPLPALPDTSLANLP